MPNLVRHSLQQCEIQWIFNLIQEEVIMCEIDCVLDAPQQWKLVSWRIRWWKFGNLWIGWRRRPISSKLFLACQPGCCGRKRGQKHPCHCRLRRGRPHDSSTSWVNLDKNVKWIPPQVSTFSLQVDHFEYIFVILNPNTLPSLISTNMICSA